MPLEAGPYKESVLKIKAEDNIMVLSYFRVFAKGRLQFLLITSIVLNSPYFKFTHN